jgi:Ca2+/Na+ antiporter
MNPYYYLFYKLSRFLNKKGNNEWGVIYGISILIGSNIMIAYVRFFNINQEESEGVYKIILIAIGILLFVTNSVLFISKRRVENIMKRYKNESEIKRKIGNAIVLLYVVLTIALIIFV